MKEMIHMLVILIQEPPGDHEIEETTDYTDFFFAFFVKKNLSVPSVSSVAKLFSW
jgi:hypothetical protein